MPAESIPRRTLTVEAEHDGLRLDHFLTALLPELSRAQIQRLIKEGRVLAAGGTAVRSSTGVHAGQTFSVDVPEPAPSTIEAEPLPLLIVYEDRRHRRARQACRDGRPSGRRAQLGTLVNALLHHVKDLSGVGGELRPGIVHRLDRGTSGLMVVAKHDAAHQELSRQFADREVEKEYIALVWGVVHAGKRIDAPIGRDPQQRQKMSTRARRARSAVTRVTWSRHFPGVSLLKVAIATGRTHQIRVHLNAIGHPIVGDALYGGVHRRTRRRPARRPAAGAAVPALGAAVVHAPRRRPAGGLRFAAAA